MPEYRVTFGQKYHSRETHPTFPDAHPDGWLTIVAPDYWTARHAAVQQLGTSWSDIMTLETLGVGDQEWKRLFPLGELGRIEAPLVTGETAKAWDEGYEEGFYAAQIDEGHTLTSGKPKTLEDNPYTGQRE